MAISKNISQNEKKKQTTKDEVYLEERILIPKEEDQNSLFSWRKLWLFTGPGWLSKYLLNCFLAQIATSLSSMY